MKKIIIMLIVLMFLFPSVIGQEHDEEEQEPWHLNLSYTSLYIGEVLWANISGQANSSYVINFDHYDNVNCSFYITGSTNENGSAYRRVRSFQKDDVGFYEVTLYYNEMMEDRVIINVMYDKDYDQDLKIQELENENERLWGMINYLIKYNKDQDANYIKWFTLMVVFLAVSIFFVLFFGTIFSPVIQYYFKKSSHEENTNIIRWLINFIFAGVFEKRPFDYEYQGYPSDFNEDKPIEKGIDCDELKAYAGMTDEEIEKARRLKHYGDKHEEIVPYGKLTKEQFDYFDQKEKGILGKIWQYVDPWNSKYKNEGGTMKYHPIIVIWLCSTIIISVAYYIFNPSIILWYVTVFIICFTSFYLVYMNRKDGD